jgi:hypothetical protein
MVDRDSVALASHEEDTENSEEGGLQLSKILSIASVLLITCIFHTAWCATWYVDGSVAASGDGKSWEAAFQTIQDGINASSDGDTIIVAEGTYCENIRFRWKLKTIFEESFDSYTNLYTHEELQNAGWTVINGSGEPEVAWRLWSTTGDSLNGADPALPGMSGNYMIADSDMSETAVMDEELITPEIDCSGWVHVRLDFNKFYWVYKDDPDHLQIAGADVRSFDEAAGSWGDWENLLHYDIWTMEEDEDADAELLDLSTYDGEKIQIRWHFYEATYDYWFAVDDIVVSGVPEGPSPHVSARLNPSACLEVSVFICRACFPL